MALVYADRVKETTTTTGTGTLTLAGAASGFQSFAAVGNSNTCEYCLLGGNGTDWETGVGTYTSSGTTLSRDTVYASSNSGSKISLTGTSTVFVSFTARRATLPATYQAAPSNPTGTSSTTGVMMGLAGTITPAKSGTVVFNASGAITNNTITRGSQVTLYYSTGTAPTNGAALTGTSSGAIVFHDVAAANLTVPFALNRVVTGLTVGTAYWFDLSLASRISGTSAMFGVTLTAFEI